MLSCMNVSTSWTTDDAWIFSAIAIAGKEHCSLTELIGAADRINHDVLQEAEFTRAIGRLVGAGLVEADPIADQYRLTEAGRRLKGRWRHGMFGWITTIPPGLRRLGEPPDHPWSLPTHVFETALNDYLSRANETLNKLRSRRRPARGG